MVKIWWTPTDRERDLNNHDSVHDDPVCAFGMLSNQSTSKRTFIISIGIFIVFDCNKSYSYLIIILVNQSSKTEKLN